MLLKLRNLHDNQALENSKLIPSSFLNTIEDDLFVSDRLLRQFENFVFFNDVHEDGILATAANLDH